jgi:hypothetical protein
MTQKQQRHKDTRTLPNSNTHHLCRAQEAQTHTTRGAAHAIDQKSRRCANEENVHQTEMLEDPLIIVRGEELVEPDPTAREHHPAAWSGPAPGQHQPTEIGPRAQQQLRLFKMDSMGVDCHPCASKQVQNVRFARREQGLGTGPIVGAKGAAGERFEVGFEGGPHMSGGR